MTQAASGEHALEAGQIFSDDETDVFTHVVTLAEKAGKHVELMVVPGPTLMRRLSRPPRGCNPRAS